MSQPSFPSLPPISRGDAISLILSSISMEKIGLNHIINAEGEKIQYIAGTIPNVTSPPATIEDVLAINDSLVNVLDSIAQQQMLLTGKLQKALGSSVNEGPREETGPTGATGAAGPVGVTGWTGPTAINITCTAAFAANTSEPNVSITVGGTAVPLPDDQVLSPDITVNTSNTGFTVNEGGRYRISYQINTSTAIAAGTRITIDGVGVVSSTIVPNLLLTNFSNEIIEDISAGSTISLEMFGIVSAVVLLTNGAGATLMITRLS